MEGLEWGQIDSGKNSWLERPFEESEIKRAIDECEGDKVLGSRWVHNGDIQERVGSDENKIASSVP